MGEGLLDQCWQYPLYQRRPQSTERRTGDQQAAALGIEADGAANAEQQQGRSQQLARTGAPTQARGEQHTNPDQPQRQQGEPGEGVHPQRQTLVNGLGQRADGGEKGAQVKANQDHQHQQGSLACGLIRISLIHRVQFPVLGETGGTRDTESSGLNMADHRQRRQKRQPSGLESHLEIK